MPAVPCNNHRPQRRQQPRRHHRGGPHHRARCRRRHDRGAVGARIHPTSFCYRGDGDLSHRNDDPERASRPFDAGRDGLVNGEGAAAFVLESRQHAQHARRAQFSPASSATPAPTNRSPEIKLSGPKPLAGLAIRRVLVDALQRANLKPADLSHVNAHGLSTIADDRYEAQAIHDVLNDVPVTQRRKVFSAISAQAAAPSNWPFRFSG